MPGVRWGDGTLTGVSDRGLSGDGVARLHDLMASHVERKAMPGLVALLARHGDVHVEVVGTKAFGDTEPLERDSIFRIASLSKPVAAAAALILVDDGTLQLQDSVEDLLPELAHRRVLRSIDAELDDTVPATRPVTVEDLLTFRLGFGAVMAPPRTYPIQRAEEELELHTLSPPWPPPPLTPDEWIERFGTLPLMHQPGEKWMYNTGSQVLGVLVERAAGEPLERFLRARVFEPLGMHDTGFSVPDDKVARFTTAYQPDPDSGRLSVLDAPDESFWGRPPSFPNAAGWLVSTLDDFWSFVQMLIGQGVHRGSRILSETSVRRMTSDHLTKEQRQEAELFLGPHGSWGLGLLVPAAGEGEGRDETGIPGGFGWNGGTGTTWHSDVERGLTGILFTQRAMTSPKPPEVFTDFWDCAYGAIDDR